MRFRDSVEYKPTRMHETRSSAAPHTGLIKVYIATLRCMDS